MDYILRNNPRPVSWLPDVGGPSGGTLGPLGTPIQGFGSWIMGAGQVLGGGFLLVLALLVAGILTIGSSRAARQLAK